MHILVPLIAALVPLIITPHLFFYFDITPKLVVFLFGVSIALLYYRQNAAHIATLLRSRAGVWFAALLACQWVVLAVSTALSSHPVLSLHGGAWRRYGFITQTALLVFTLIASAWLAQSRENIRSLLRAFTVSGALVSIYGIAQYFGLDPFLAASGYEAGEGAFTIVRPPGTLGHADYLAAWLLFVVFGALALRRMEESGWRTFALAAAVLAIFAIVLSGTRAAIVGLLAGALLWLLLERPRAHARGAWLTAAGVVAFALLFVSPAGLKLRARLHWSLDDSRGGARLRLWQDSTAMIAVRPFAGFGPETFGTEFPRFESIALASAYPDFYHESPHNALLDVAVSQGITAAILLIALCAVAVIAAIKSESTLRIPLISALAATLVAHQFSVLILPTALYFYFLLAMMISLPAIAPVAHPLNRATSILCGLVCFALAATLTIFTGRIVIADRALAIAQTKIASADVRAAAVAYKASLIWQPSADLWYSRQMASLAARTPIFRTRINAHQQALEAAIHATSEAEDRQNAWYNLATLLAIRNDPTGVEQALRNAIAWAPAWFKPHWSLAQFLVLANRPQEALAEASAAVERDGGKDPEVYQTWLNIKGR